jgi:hypothetical protein
MNYTIANPLTGFSSSGSFTYGAGGWLGWNTISVPVSSGPYSVDINAYDASSWGSGGNPVGPYSNNSMQLIDVAGKSVDIRY